jgi:mannose-6-phosphate isomerase-like protein (cupin superfamily)
MNPIPKTIFCEIDGVILSDRTGDVPICLASVSEQFSKWKELQYKVVLTTSRPESRREETEYVLREMRLEYYTMVMGLPEGGDRVLINAKMENGVENRAFALNLVKNGGMGEVEVESANTTIPDRFLFEKVEKPWGYEELVECNDKYVVKKLFMKAGHSCSTQYHRLKRETMIILTGKLWIAVGQDMEHLEGKIYEFGETITVDPYTVHKMRAIEDCLFLEGSTNELWDVVRLEDSYGRVAGSAATEGHENDFERFR